MSNHDVPYMQMWPKDFWTSAKVLWLSMQQPSAHLEYNALLQQMWVNGGAFPDDDGLIATALRVPIEHWLARRRAIMQVCKNVTDSDGVVYITQSRIEGDFADAQASLQRKRDEAAHARAARSSKSRKTNSKTSRSSDNDKRQPQAPETEDNDWRQHQSPEPSAPMSSASTSSAKQSNAEHSIAREGTDVPSEEEPHPENLVAIEKKYVATNKPISQQNQDVKSDSLYDRLQRLKEDNP